MAKKNLTPTHEPQPAENTEYYAAVTELREKKGCSKATITRAELFEKLYGKNIKPCKDY